VAGHLALENRDCRVVIAPDLGAGVVNFDAKTTGGPRPVLRPARGESALDLACQVLAPFSNRISGHGFVHAGTFYPVAPNVAGERYPLHGDAFQRPWHVKDASATTARLFLPGGEIGPWRYTADLEYKLDGPNLFCTLEVQNIGPELPFGGGFHPWLPHFGGTTLVFPATGVWLEDIEHLPTELVSLADCPTLDFRTPSSLPAGWINNAFTEASGPAFVAQPELGLSVELVHGPGLDYAIVYSPNKSSDFFCYEPVSHPVDAINMTDTPGLTSLRPGERNSFQLGISWRALRFSQESHTAMGASQDPITIGRDA